MLIRFILSKIFQQFHRGLHEARTHGVVEIALAGERPAFRGGEIAVE